MPPTNPTQQLQAAPLDELLRLLLKQFVQILKQRQIVLSTQAIATIAEQAAGRQFNTEQIKTLQAALIEVVQESVALLRTRWDLTFAESLGADMTSIGGWETTAEFLEIANHKSNAELRIAAGASLLAFLGHAHFVDYLFTVIEHDAGANDADAVFAKRSLSHLSQVDLQAENWEVKVRAALQNHA